MATRDKNESILDGVINEVSRLTQVGRETAADWVQSVSPDAANLIRPEPKTQRVKPAAKRTIKVTSSKSPTTQKATAKKSPVKKTATAAKGAARKASPRSSHRSASR